MVTDEFGHLILGLFNGENSLEEIIDTAVCGFGDPNSEKVDEFCKLILGSGLLENIPPRSLGDKRRQQLSSVHLSLSDRCNLNCTYCYARERVEKRHSLLTLDQYIGIIDDIVGINPNVVFTLTGGEPLLNANCLKIAEHIKSKGASCYLLSNGILIEENNIQRKRYSTCYPIE